MKTTITTKNFELTEAIASYVESKFERITKRIDDNTTVHITLKVSKQRHVAEARLYVSGTLIKMSVIEKDLYASVDKLVDKLSYQINKMIDKSQEKAEESIRFLKQDYKGVEKEAMEELKPIVKRKQFDMKPMMEEEALLQMEMLGHSFFFFFNGETNSMCLLYKRKDGNYGLIESVR